MQNSIKFLYVLLLTTICLVGSSKSQFSARSPLAQPAALQTPVLNAQTLERTLRDQISRTILAKKAFENFEYIPVPQDYPAIKEMIRFLSEPFALKAAIRLNSSSTFDPEFIESATKQIINKNFKKNENILVFQSDLRTKKRLFEKRNTFDLVQALQGYLKGYLEESSDRNNTLFYETTNSPDISNASFCKAPATYKLAPVSYKSISQRLKGPPPPYPPKSKFRSRIVNLPNLCSDESLAKLAPLFFQTQVLDGDDDLQLKILNFQSRLAVYLSENLTTKDCTPGILTALRSSLNFQNLKAISVLTIQVHSQALDFKTFYAPHSRLVENCGFVSYPAPPEKGTVFGCFYFTGVRASYIASKTSELINSLSSSDKATVLAGGDEAQEVIARHYLKLRRTDGEDVTPFIDSKSNFSYQSYLQTRYDFAGANLLSPYSRPSKLGAPKYHPSA